jgi:RimJ/RimL family protein N-acetyltransferase
MREQLYAPLTDGDLSLEPLGELHRNALRAACAADPDIWHIYATNFGPPDFDRNFDALLGHEHRMPYAIMAGGAAVGMTAFLRPDWTAQTVEIGNTYLAPAHRGTGLNARIKALLLGHAFAVGIRRIEFRIDERNGRSQAAVRKLGAVKEGVLRAERVTWTGYLRDTGLFSLLAGDWVNPSASA